jgi:hypothetical protein
MSSYESKVWSKDEKGRDVLVPVTSWEIGDEMGHHTGCRVRDELRRSTHIATTPERRLELARATACTCGRREEMEAALAAPDRVISHDHRDNRDPAEVGRAWLNRPK